MKHELLSTERKIFIKETIKEALPAFTETYDVAIPKREDWECDDDYETTLCDATHDKFNAYLESFTSFLKGKSFSLKDEDEAVFYDEVLYDLGWNVFSNKMINLAMQKGIYTCDTN